MAAKGRSTATILGATLVVIGVVGALVLWWMAERRPGDAVDSFARAPVGCTTTLEFSQTGTFFVYEETGGPVEVPSGQCEPTADPLEPFGFTFTDADGGEITPRRDDSVSYEIDGRVGTSVARLRIEDEGEYEITVRGDDAAAVAAVGRDPSQGVSDLRAGAVAIGIAGVLLGLLLIVFGRLARQPEPDAPALAGDATWAADPSGSWPPAPPKLDVPETDTTPTQPTSPWAPPSPGDRRS